MVRWMSGFPTRHKATVSLGGCAAVVAAAALIALTGSRPGHAVVASKSAADTLVYAIPSTPPDLDPNSSAQFVESEVFTNTMSRLFDYKYHKNADGTYVMEGNGYQPVTGSLAQSWTVSKDKKVITINLRRGAKNYLGHTFSATDVRYTIDRLLALNGTAGEYLHGIGITKKSNLRVLSPYKIQFRLDFPAVLFFKMLSIPHMGIYDHLAYQQHATKSDPWATRWAHTDAVGWGAYYLSQNEQGVQVVLTADPHYFGSPKPQVKTVVEKEIPSTANQLALLKGGAVDVVADLDPRQLQSLKGDSSIHVATFAPAQTHSDLYMNNNIKPFNNVLVRRAVCYALPYDQLVKAVGLGTARQQKSPLPANYEFYAPQLDPYSYNPDKAKALLKQAGYPNGFTTTIKFSNAVDPTSQQQAVILQAALANVGIKASLISLPFATYNQAWLGLKYDMGIETEGAFIPDYTYDLRLWYFGPKSKNFLDFTDYYNPAVNKLMDKASYTFAQSQRAALAKQLQQKILNDAPICYMIEPGTHIVSGPNVHGVSYFTYSAQWFKLWSKS